MILRLVSVDVMPCCLIDGYPQFTVLCSPSDQITSYPATGTATPATEHGSSICGKIVPLLDTGGVVMLRGVTFCLAGCCQHWMNYAVFQRHCIHTMPAETCSQPDSSICSRHVQWGRVWLDALLTRQNNSICDNSVKTSYITLVILKSYWISMDHLWLCSLGFSIAPGCSVSHSSLTIYYYPS